MQRLNFKSALFFIPALLVLNSCQSRNFSELESDSALDVKTDICIKAAFRKVNPLYFLGVKDKLSPSKVDEWVLSRFGGDPNEPFSPSMQLVETNIGNYGGKVFTWKRRFNDWNPIYVSDLDVECLVQIQKEPLGNPFSIIKAVGEETAHKIGFKEYETDSEVFATSPDLEELNGFSRKLREVGVDVPLGLFRSEDPKEIQRALKLQEKAPQLKDDPSFAFNYTYMQNLADLGNPRLPLATSGVLYQHDLSYHALHFLMPTDLLRLCLNRIHLIFKVVEILEKIPSENHKAMRFLLSLYSRDFDLAEGNSIYSIMNDSNNILENRTNESVEYTEHRVLQQDISMNILHLWSLFGSRNPDTTNWLMNIANLRAQISEVEGLGVLLRRNDWNAIRSATKQVIEQNKSFIEKTDEIVENLEAPRFSVVDRIEEIQQAVSKNSSG